MSREATLRKLLNRYVFVGQAPNQQGGKDALAGGAAFRRFAPAFDLDMDEWLWFTHRLNLLNYWPGSEGKGDAFPIDVAMAAAKRMTPMLAEKRVFFVGKRVAAAFECAHPSYLTWERSHLPFWCSVLPHPSGIVTWWNDPENVVLLRDFMRWSVENLE